MNNVNMFGETVIIASSSYDPLIETTTLFDFGCAYGDNVSDVSDTWFSGRFYAAIFSKYVMVDAFVQAKFPLPEI